MTQGRVQKVKRSNAELKWVVGKKTEIKRRHILPADTVRREKLQFHNWFQSELHKCFDAATLLLFSFLVVFKWIIFRLFRRFKRKEYVKEESQKKKPIWLSADSTKTWFIFAELAASLNLAIYRHFFSLPVCLFLLDAIPVLLRDRKFPKTTATTDSQNINTTINKKKYEINNSDRRVQRPEKERSQSRARKTNVFNYCHSTKLVRVFGTMSNANERRRTKKSRFHLELYGAYVFLLKLF